jgi:hypothetical protein
VAALLDFLDALGVVRPPTRQKAKAARMVPSHSIIFGHPSFEGLECQQNDTSLQKQ